jgi:transcriptional regulator with XRE-family HTH domain
MEFIKKIREQKGYSQYRMAKELGFNSTGEYIRFENAKKAINAQNLIKLWILSRMNAKAFLEMIKEEVLEDKS